MGHGSSTPETVRRYVGNCQVCEGDFKTTKGGLVALHGYKRPGDGYIRGRCPGENALAYERSRDLIPAVIEMYDRAVAGHDDTLRKIDRGEVESFQRKTYAPPYHAEVRRSEVAPDEWERRLQGFRATVKKMRDDADERRRHLQRRYDGWSLRPLREVDELGRTVEQREATEARRGERVAAQRAKEDKKATLAADRGRKLVERRRILDGAGKLLREAAERGDREGALAVLRELGKKKNASTLKPSFATSTTVEKLKLRGLVPDDLTGAGEAIGYEWEEDLDADQALLALDLARRNESRRRGVSYRNYELWRK